MRKAHLALGCSILSLLCTLASCKERQEGVSEPLTVEALAAAEPPPKQRKPANAEANETPRYVETLQKLGQRQGALTDNVAKWYQSVHVILVPGLGLTAVQKLAASAVWKVPGDKNLVSSYMTDFKAACDETKISYEVVDINTEASVLTNGALVAKRILAATQHVLVIGYSKGGLDALEGLISLTPEQRKGVAGFIALQAPLQGIPLQDMLGQNTITRAAKNLLMVMLGGEAQANVDATVQARTRYLTYYQDAIAQILNEVPILAAGTYKMNADGSKADTVFELTRNFLWDSLKMQNDGVVPIDSARIAGAPFVGISGSDHLSSVMNYRGAPDVDRKALLKTLLQMLGEHALEARP